MPAGALSALPISPLEDRGIMPSIASPVEAPEIPLLRPAQLASVGESANEGPRCWLRCVRAARPRGMPVCGCGLIGAAQANPSAHGALCAALAFGDAQ